MIIEIEHENGTGETQIRPSKGAACKILKLDTGIEVEIHGEGEFLSITMGDKTFDISTHNGEIMVDGFALNDLIFDSLMAKKSSLML